MPKLPYIQVYTTPEIKHKTAIQAATEGYRSSSEYVEQLLRKTLKMTTTELRTNDSGDVWAVQLDAEGNIIGVSEALHYDDHAEAAKGNVEFRTEPEDVEWAEAHLTRQYVG